MYAIQFVDDDQLPAGHDFLFIGVPDGGLIFYRESALSPRSLEDSWSAYRARLAGPPEPGADVIPFARRSALLDAASGR